MVARYETHLLIDELQREQILETQAKQEQVLPVTQDVRSKPPAELKTIYQLKATDRPADVKAKLRERGHELFLKLRDTCDGTMSLLEAMECDATQLITDILSCAEVTDVWMRDVTATATQIVQKYNDLQQEHITLQTR